ncbi:MAG: DNA-processing protein DprA [Proteobacteria bacterium]|nr:DNA-processing protein DprA [Pseudomonadota bacterium]
MAEKRVQEVEANARRQYLLPWFWLKSVPGVGNLWFSKLLDLFGDPSGVREAGKEALVACGVPERIARVLASHSLPGDIEKELDRAVQRPGLSIITLHDPGYPPLLAKIPDPPPFLYAYGNLGSMEKCVAVVGSRNATQYGLSITMEICRDLAGAGVLVVSGMARGIDTAAHRGALAGGGRTVAVLGCGLDTVYPPENHDLFHRIAENGAVISEFPLADPPKPSNFPVRNRIISGMSHAIVVVEASKKSGSLITAGLALEQGREVFAVPGSVHSFKSSGTHGLLRQGAALAERASDILDFLGGSLSPLERVPVTGARPDGKDRAVQDLDSEEKAVLETLSPYPVHIDVLIRRLAMEPGHLAGLLLQLELKGLVCQDPGKMFSRGSL